jgi:uncharacterized protein
LEVFWQFVLNNWALLSIAATMVMLIGVPVLILGRYVHIILNIMKTTPPPLSMGPRDFTPLKGEIVDFRSFDGFSLRGKLVRGDPAGPSRGMIVFAHEFASDMYSCARYCRPLVRAGYDVFSFDFRCHGHSSKEEGYTPRQWLTDREVSDIRGAIAFVEDLLEQQGRPKDIGLFGISRGACACIAAAVHNPNVKAIVADGVFSTDSILEHLMKRWAYIFAKVRVVYENHPPLFWVFLRWLVIQVCRRQMNCEFPSVRKALLRMPPRPLLMIHGEKDSYIPVHQVEMLYTIAGQPKYLWVVANAKHNQGVITQPERYAHRTISFLDRYLAGRTFEEDGYRVPPKTEVDRPGADKGPGSSAVARDSLAGKEG